MPETECLTSQLLLWMLMNLNMSSKLQQTPYSSTVLSHMPCCFVTSLYKFQ